MTGVQTCALPILDGLGAVQCNVAAHVGPAVDFAFGEVVDAAVLTEMDGSAAQHQTAVHRGDFIVTGQRPFVCTERAQRDIVA